MSAGGRFSRRRDNASQPLMGSGPSSPASPSPFNHLASSDPPIRRSRNLPSNPKSPPTASPLSPLSPLASSSSFSRSPVLAPSSSPYNRFSRAPGAQHAPEPAAAASPRRNGLGRSPSAKDQHAAAAQAQVIADWNLPRKRGQTPVSEAKFYSQLEKVSKFMHMLLNKERETAMINSVHMYGNHNRYNNNQQPPLLLDDEDDNRDFPTLDLLSPDFEGTRKIVVRADILSTEKLGEPAPDLMDFAPQLPASRGGRFGMVNSNGVAKEQQNKEANNSGSYGLFGLYGMSGGGTGLTYAPLQDNRKMKNTLVDAKYSHVPELDDIEVEMTFLLQAATNPVIEIVAKEYLKEYLDVLVFFGSRSGLWCRHVLVKLSDHLEIEWFGEELKQMPLYKFKMEYSLEGVWAAAEIIFSKMMNYITLDHLFLNLQKKCTPESYDNIVRVVHVCLPLEAEGAAKPERLLAQSQEENNQYFRFLFTDLWNLHPVLHPIIIKRLDMYLANDEIKKIMEPVDMQGISFFTLTYPGGVKYLQRLQIVQRIDQFMPIPALCDIVREARLAGDEKRINYAHNILTSFSELMSPNMDANGKAEKVSQILELEEFARYIAVLAKSYVELRGAIMFRQNVLSRLGDYMQHPKLKATAMQALGDQRQLEVLHHYLLLQTFVDHFEKFNPNAQDLIDLRLSELAQTDGRESDAGSSSSSSKSGTPKIGSPAVKTMDLTSPKLSKSYRTKPKPPPPATPQNRAVTVRLSEGMDGSESGTAQESETTESDDERHLLKGKKKMVMSPAPAHLQQDRAFHRVIRDDDDNDSEYEFLRVKPIYMDVVEGRNPMEMIPGRKSTQEELAYGGSVNSSSSSTRDHPRDPPPGYDDILRSPETDAFHALAQVLTQSMPKENGTKKPAATIVKTQTAPATSHQMEHQLAPEGELPEELQKMVQSQAKHLTFLATQNFTLYPYRKVQGMRKKEKKGKKEKDKLGTKKKKKTNE